MHATACAAARAASAVDIAVPTALVADALGRHRDFRVLRRIGALDVAGREPVGAVRTGCALDVETTGLSPITDKVVELAVQRFAFDEEGRIVRAGRVRSWLEDPGAPLSAEVTRVTGLTDADVAGQRIDDALAAEMIGSVDVVVAHHAAFDRPFVERRLPAVAGAAWACSLEDVPWADHGFEGRALGHLLCQCGWFFEPHRAAADVLALLHLLAHRLDADRTVLGTMVEAAGRTTAELVASAAFPGSRMKLEERGYRWSRRAGAYAKVVPVEDAKAEVEWAEVYVYDLIGRPVARTVTWRERYAT